MLLMNTYGTCIIFLLILLSLDIEIVNFVVLSFVPLFPLLGLRSVRGITRMRIFSDMLRF